MVYEWLYINDNTITMVSFSQVRDANLFFSMYAASHEPYVEHTFNIHSSHIRQGVSEQLVRCLRILDSEATALTALTAVVRRLAHVPPLR